MQDGKQAVLITEGNQQQVVLLDEDVSPEHIVSALQHGAIQHNIVQQPAAPIIMSQAPAAASTSTAVNGGQVQYLLTDNGQILMSDLGQSAMTIAAPQQAQSPQLLVTHSGLVRVDASPRAKKDIIVSGKSLINQAALQEAASRSPAANSTLRQFIDQAVDKQICEMVAEERIAVQSSNEQQLLPLQLEVVDMETEVTTSVEAQMDSNSKDETDTIGFDDEEKLEMAQGVEPDSTQSSGSDAMNGVVESEELIEPPVEAAERLPGEDTMASAGSDIPPLSALPDQVMQGDDDKADKQLVPQVINVPHDTVEIDTAAIFGEAEQIDIESASEAVVDIITAPEQIVDIDSVSEVAAVNIPPTEPVSDTDVVPEPIVDVDIDGNEDEMGDMKQAQSLVVQEEKKKSPARPIPTTVITVISPQPASRRKSHHKERQDESGSESQPETSSSSPIKSPLVPGESIASRRERRTSKPTRYYGLDVDYEVFPTDIYRSYRQESESGDDSSVSRGKQDRKKALDDGQDLDVRRTDKKYHRKDLKGRDESHESDLQSADEDRPVQKKRGRPKKSTVLEPKVSEPKVSEPKISEPEEFLEDLIIEEEIPDTKRVRSGGFTSGLQMMHFSSLVSMYDSQDSDVQSDTDKLGQKTEKRGQPKKSALNLDDSQDESKLCREEKGSKLIRGISSALDSRSPKNIVMSQVQHSDEIVPAELDKPVKRRGRPPKRSSITITSPAVGRRAASDQSLGVDSVGVPAGAAVDRVDQFSHSPSKSQVVVHAEVHHVNEVDTVNEVNTVNEVEDHMLRDKGEEVQMDGYVETAEEVVVDSSMMEVDVEGTEQVIVDAVVEHIEQVPVAEKPEAVEVNEEVVEVEEVVCMNEEVVGEVQEEVITMNEESVKTDVSDLKEASTEDHEKGINVDDHRKDPAAKRRGRPRKSLSEVSSSKTDSVDKHTTDSAQSEEESPRRSSRPKESINYNEEDAQDALKKPDKLEKPPVITSAQLEEECNKVYVLQKEVTDLKFVKDSLEMRLAQQSGSPEEIRSLQSRIDKLQMQNSALDTKFKNLEKSHKIGINIKGMKFSVKRDITSPPASNKQTDKATVRLHEIELAEQELKIRETLVEKKEMKNKALDRELDERGAMLTKRESRLDRLERKLKSQEKELEYKEKQLRRFENDFRDLGGSGSPRKGRLSGDLELVVQKKELEERETEVTHREEELTHRETALAVKEKLLGATEKQLMALNTELNEKAQYLKTKEQSQSSEEEDDTSATDADTDSSVKATQRKRSGSSVSKQKSKGKSPRGRDATPKSISALLTRKAITSRRSSSVSSQEVSASPKNHSRSSTPKGTKASVTPKVEKTARSPDRTPGSAKRKYTKRASQKNTPTSVKKLKVTPKTVISKNTSPVRKYTKKTPVEKSPVKRCDVVEKAEKKTTSIKSPVMKSVKKMETPKSSVKISEKTSPLKLPKLNSLKSPKLNPLKSPKLNPLKSPDSPKLNPLKSPDSPKLNPLKSPKSNPLKSPKSNPLKSPKFKSEKKTVSQKSPLKKDEKKRKSLASPLKTSEKKNLLKSPYYKVIYGLCIIRIFY